MVVLYVTRQQNYLETTKTKRFSRQKFSYFKWTCQYSLKKNKSKPIAQQKTKTFGLFGRDKRELGAPNECQVIFISLFKTLKTSLYVFC